MISNSRWEACVDHYTGNSRDPPTLFQISCLNAKNGCDHKSVEYVAIKQHGLQCKWTSSEAGEKLSQEKEA